MKYILAISIFFVASEAIAQSAPKKILISYFSKTDQTKLLAEEIAKGVLSIQNIQLTIKTIDKTTQKDLLEADAIIIGTPVYNANVAPDVVKFMSDWPFEEKPLKDKIGAAFVTAGGFSAGEELAQTNLLHSMMVFGMIVVGGEDWTSPFGASEINNEGSYKASTKLDSLFARKGYLLGKRVAELAKKIK
jgi:NAD(P)H dehydrogenase (quinone)